MITITAEPAKKSQWVIILLGLSIIVDEEIFTVLPYFVIDWMELLPYELFLNISWLVPYDLYD